MYEITTDAESDEQIEALPQEALPHFAELRAVLEVSPWAGAPQHAARPDGGLRNIVFGPEGQGLAVYLILDHQRRVDLLRVYWLG